MNYPSNVVSIHPYFKVQPGQMGAFKAVLPAFIEKTRSLAHESRLVRARGWLAPVMR